MQKQKTLKFIYWCNFFVKQIIHKHDRCTHTDKFSGRPSSFLFLASRRCRDNRVSPMLANRSSLNDWLSSPEGSPEWVSIFSASSFSSWMQKTQKKIEKLKRFIQNVQFRKLNEMCSEWQCYCSKFRGQRSETTHSSDPFSLSPIRGCTSWFQDRPLLPSVTAVEDKENSILFQI